MGNWKTVWGKIVQNKKRKSPEKKKILKAQFSIHLFKPACFFEIAFF